MAEAISRRERGERDADRERRQIVDESLRQVNLPAASAGAAGPVRSGTGTPESVVTAPVGTLFTRTDGGAGTTLYVKESGTGNTGWVGK